MDLRTGVRFPSPPPQTDRTDPAGLFLFAENRGGESGIEMAFAKQIVFRRSFFDEMHKQHLGLFGGVLHNIMPFLKQVASVYIIRFT